MSSALALDQHSLILGLTVGLVLAVFCAAAAVLQWRRSQQFKLQLEAAQSVEPLKEKLENFEKLIRETYEREGRERFHLEKEIESLAIETQSLSTALRGDAKAQGDWGELLLERVLESSGLRAGHEFETQASLKASSGDLVRPDVIVKLPGDRVLVIDSKVSLTAWDRYCRAKSDDARHMALKDHVHSLKRHIHSLGAKRYDMAEGIESPAVVFMFTRIEPAWIEALRYEPEILEEAAKAGIAVVSPTTLFATMKTVASLWARERQGKNALLIAEEAGKLYDKFVQFSSELEDSAKDLERASETLAKARRRLTEGPGNLSSRAEKLRLLGAKAAKRLPNAPEQDSESVDPVL